jgi:hypothetical protein
MIGSPVVLTRDACALPLQVREHSRYAYRSNQDMLRRVLKLSSVDALDFLPSPNLLLMREVEDRLGEH